MNIEPLESRIAPSGVFSFTADDGDKVKVAVSGAVTSQQVHDAVLPDIVIRSYGI